MKAFSEELTAHLSGHCQTLANCWRLVCRDGAVLGFTDHDRDLVIDGLVYEAATGLDASQSEASLGLSPDSAEISGALTSARITETDIVARKYDNARLEHYIINWSELSEHALMSAGYIGDIIREGSLFRAEIRSLTALLDQTSGRRFDRTCDASLGDTRCRVAIEAMKDSAVVSKVFEPELLLVTTGVQRASGWYAGGLLLAVSGSNAGRSIEIAGHTNREDGILLELWQPLPSSFETGDQLSLQPGCDKQFATCRDRFSNHSNFQGFPHLPGSEFPVKYAASGGEFDGEPIIL